jgi:hypothetical protein
MHGSVMKSAKSILYPISLLLLVAVIDSVNAKIEF